MRKFLYLRILAITNLVVIIYCLAATLWIIKGHRHLGGGGMYMTGMGIIALCAFPSIFILFIYARYFPDKEIPKTVGIGQRIGDALGWIGAMIMLLAGIVMIVVVVTKKQGDNEEYYGAFICALVAGLTLTQLITGGRLLKTIRTNARLILENSFN